MSTSDEMWDFVHKRWEEADRRRAALHRRRMRWWRHMREYVSMKRLFVYGLVRPQRADTSRNRTPLPDHPPWSHDRAGGSNWWPKHRWARQG